MIIDVHLDHWELHLSALSTRENTIRAKSSLIETVAAIRPTAVLLGVREKRADVIGSSLYCVGIG